MQFVVVDRLQRESVFGQHVFDNGEIKRDRCFGISQIFDIAVELFVRKRPPLPQSRPNVVHDEMCHVQVAAGHEHPTAFADVMVGIGVQQMAEYRHGDDKRDRTVVSRKPVVRDDLSMRVVHKTEQIRMFKPRTLAGEVRAAPRNHFGVDILPGVAPLCSQKLLQRPRISAAATAQFQYLRLRREVALAAQLGDEIIGVLDEFGVIVEDVVSNANAHAQ